MFRLVRGFGVRGRAGGSVSVMQMQMARLEAVLGTAVEAGRKGHAALVEALETLEAPIYVTDAQGVVTYYNRACIGFAGRTPAVGKDRWCVTWKLYTNDGEFLPHDQCPMAQAIREKRALRGLSAVAERPDGTRVNFVPCPTPILGPQGELLGAVNMLIDVTDARQVAELRDQARRCRRLAVGAGDQATADVLASMAREYESRAAELELKSPARLYLAA